jgi:2,4-dienoyl-CoA reductase-like NADH-dependent reductase (Old Yellow Enzyme family)
MNLYRESLKIKSITIKNRIGMSPMCMYSATDGMANDWHFVHYATRAIGGAGLIIQEATAVSPEGRISPYDLGLWKDEQIEPLKKITAFLRSQGCVPAIQLAHAGRKASHDKPSNGEKQLLPSEGGCQTVAPSPIPYYDNELPPEELTEDGISRIINDFREAALRASKSGFQAVEIHAAHGYLLSEFLSPLTNKRTDRFGGSFENRVRLLLMIVDAVKTVWDNDLPIIVRLSATEWAEGGWDIHDTVKLAEILKERGVDIIDCSSGGNIPTQQIQIKPLYQVPFAEAVRKTGIGVAAVGLITQPEEIERILQNKQADMVLLGRELLRNPYFPLNTAGMPFPEQYKRGKR